jgi:hypothetical protein
MHKISGHTPPVSRSMQSNGLLMAAPALGARRVDNDLETQIVPPPLLGYPGLSKRIAHNGIWEIGYLRQGSKTATPKTTKAWK